MKKALILIMIIILVGVVAIGCYSIEKNKLNIQKSSTESAENSNNSTLQNTNSTLNNTQTATNNNISNTKNNNSNQSQSQSQSGNSNQSKLQNMNNQIQDLNVSPDFTQEEINTLNNLGNSQKIDLGAGTTSPVINLNYYSIVNGKKYYMEYENAIAYITFSPDNNSRAVTPNKNGNYSWVNFKEYVDANGQTINQSEFLNGKLSFNLNNPSNLTNQDKINMIKKIAAMYFNYGGYGYCGNSFTVSKQCLENGVGNNNISMDNMKVNLNNTINVDGQLFYALEVEPNEPFYISLTGLVCINQEHYLSKPFNIPSYTNAQVKQLEKGM